MKNIIISSLLIFCFGCKAQTTISLQQMEECVKRPNHDAEGCPDLENATYVKDVGNRLDQFVGTWKGTYGGKQFEIKLEKKLQFGEDIKWDKLIGRALVKNNAGNIIYNSMSKPDNDTYFWGANFQGKTYEMSFVGNYDCLESGNIFIYTKNGSPNEMILFYSQDTDGLLNRAKCPNYETFASLFPMQKMTLVKQ